MEKEWFILIERVKEGPYNVIELRSDSRITPDTLVWKADFSEWIPMRQVAELKIVFEDTAPGIDEEQVKLTPLKPSKLPQDDTLTLRSDPPYFWILIALFFIAYVIYQLYAVR